MGEKKKTGLDFLFLNLLIYHPKDTKKKNVSICNVLIDPSQDRFHF